jgi:hypothetical protein
MAGCESVRLPLSVSDSDTRALLLTLPRRGPYGLPAARLRPDIPGQITGPSTKTALTPDQPMSRVASLHRWLLAHVRAGKRPSPASTVTNWGRGLAGRRRARLARRGRRARWCLARLQPARRQPRRSGKEVVASLPARLAHPRQGPPRVPEHPPDPPRTGSRTKTRQTRPRPPARIEEPPPTTRHDVGKTVQRGNSRRDRQAEGLITSYSGTG